MGVTTLSRSPSERQKWDKIFDGLVKLLKSQQEQLETLVTERKILEDRITMQHEKWVSDVRFLEDHISQMNSDKDAQEMLRAVELAKADMMIGLKQREASVFKLKLENTSDELADFRSCFDLLRSNPTASGLKSFNQKMQGGEVRRLKHEYDKLASEKRKEVSALQVEKEFVWHQYKLLECELTDKLNGKRTELDQANEKIAKLLAGMEQLQSSNNEKDQCITSLKTNISEREAASCKLKDEVSRLSQELERLKKSGNSSDTPVLNRCTAGCSRISNSKGKKQGNENATAVKKELLGGASATPAATEARILRPKSSLRSGSSVVVKKELAPQLSDKVETCQGSRNSKRKGVVEVITIPDTPKLFTSAFKVPKLKTALPNS